MIEQNDQNSNNYDYSRRIINSSRIPVLQTILHTLYSLSHIQGKHKIKENTKLDLHFSTL